MKSKQVVLKLISKNGLELMVCKNRLHTLFKKDFKSQKKMSIFKIASLKLYTKQQITISIFTPCKRYIFRFYLFQMGHFSFLPLANGTFFIFSPCKQDTFYFYPFEMGHFFLFLPLSNGTFFLFLPLLNGTFLFLSFMNETFSIFKQCVFRSFHHHNLSKILIS